MSHDNAFVSPMARAKGLGSSKEGTHHWLLQRLTALANIPLVVWLVYSIVALKGANYAEFTAWVSGPLTPIVLILLILSVFYHAVLGAQVIIEDYIHVEWFKLLKLISLKLFMTALAVISIFSILKIAL